MGRFESRKMNGSADDGWGIAKSASWLVGEDLTRLLSYFRGKPVVWGKT